MAEAASEQGSTFYKDGQYTKYDFDQLPSLLVLKIGHVLGRKSAMKRYGLLSSKADVPFD